MGALDNIIGLLNARPRGWGLLDNSEPSPIAPRTPSPHAAPFGLGALKGAAEGPQQKPALGSLSPVDNLPDMGAPLIGDGGQFSPGTKSGNRLFGTGGEERYQLWPERIARSVLAAARDGMTAAHDAMTGELPMWAEDPETGEIHTSPQAIERARNLAGLLVGGGMPGAERGAVGAAGGKLIVPQEQLFDLSRLSEVPKVKQFDLPRSELPQGVPQRIVDITNDPGVRDKMLETISSGQKMGGANWFNTEPLRGSFGAELGKDRGNEAYRMYMEMVGATTPRSDVGTNVRNASYYYSRLMRGEGVPAVGEKNPQPYGHLAQRLHQMNAQRVAGSGFDPLKTPKPPSFVENLVGNQQPVSVDMHAFRLPAILAKDSRFLKTAYQAGKNAPKQNLQKMLANGEISMEEAANRPAYWQAYPREGEYGALEKYYQGLAKEVGLTPAQAQASAWLGGGKLTGLASDPTKPFLGFLNDRVNLTAAMRGETPTETFRKFIRGQAPLLSLGGVGAGLGATTLGQTDEPD
ncbi:MAG: hypothetical protein P4M07_28190 [Xanthobacteraceae bacterium]|nr:hypothetical protein [Xanthobacteraceae bacterium]